MKKVEEKKLMFSIIGVATGALAAGTYMLLNKDKLFGNNKEKKSIEKLQDIVQKSRTNVEDILKSMNNEVSKVRSNGKAKLENVL